MINRNVISGVKHFRRKRGVVRNRDFVNSHKRLNSYRINRNFNTSRQFKDKAKDIKNNRYLNDFFPDEAKRQRMSYIGDAFLMEKTGKRYGV
jgi:hypothetical protein